MNPDLTVCVSCKGLMPESCFKALARQTMPRWEALLLIPEKETLPKILRAFQESFSSAGRPAVTVLTGSSKRSLQSLRNQAFLRARAPILLFMDEDVILKNPNHFKNLLSLHKEKPDIAVIGGAYLNGCDSVSGGSCKSGLSFWGRAYNETVRLWTLLNPGLSPAGNLSCKKALLNPAVRFKSFGGFFGGEELHFLHQAQKTGGLFLRAKILDAPHCARHSFRDFVQRALVQGRAKAAFAAAIKICADRASRPEEDSAGFLQEYFRKKPPWLVVAAALAYLALVRLTAFLFFLLVSLRSASLRFASWRFRGRRGAS